MNLETFNRMLLESAGVGLAILEPDSLEILFGNRRFIEWFPGAAGAGTVLTDVLVEMNVDKMEARLDAGRSYSTEIKVKMKRREVSLAITISRSEHKEMPALILECQNISKIKELEYMIESYSKMVEKQNRSLQAGKERVEKLLLNIMPKSVYEELKTFGVSTPQRYDEASILMVDFVDFTEMAISQDPAGIISELNDIFTAFDRIAEQFGCERLKTIGDAYMAVSGIPEATPDHAVNIAKLAVLMLRYLKRRNEAHRQEWRCRIGINSGPVIGSIVGVQKYVYDIFGPGVNLASRMEELSDPMQITLCEDMYPLIRNEFELTDQGVVKIKGFGEKRIYSLDGGKGVLTLRSQGLADALPF
ncbi:MAG: adenylate/guanylate cyclase domain-containing protein [Pseudomonadota bacterium]